MACPDCGSWTVKADRGLSGRLVCGRCGRPLGIGASRRRRGRFFFTPPWRGGARLPPWLALVGLLCAGTLLTALVERPGGGGVPMWPSPDRSDPGPRESGIMFRNVPH
jgi:hypothetical protein